MRNSPAGLRRAVDRERATEYLAQSCSAAAGFESRLQPGSAEIVAFMAARTGNAALEQQAPVQAVEKRCAGSSGAELNRNAAAHVPLADGVWNVRGPLPEFTPIPIRIFDGPDKQKVNLRQGCFWKAGEYAIQLFECGARARAE